MCVYKLLVNIENVNYDAEDGYDEYADDKAGTSIKGQNSYFESVDLRVICSYFFNFIMKKNYL